jgi:cytochrome c oxidase subunit 4
MTSTKLYTIVFVVLFVLATAQALVESLGLLEAGTYWLALGLILALSAVKALFVAGYYMHLRWEPRSVTALATGGLLVALALAVAAAYSITG